MQNFLLYKQRAQCTFRRAVGGASHNPGGGDMSGFLREPSFGPLPSVCDGSVIGTGVYAMYIETGHGGSAIQTRNGSARDSDYHMRRIRASQFMLQVAAEVFASDSSEGGALAFTRVDKHTRATRAADPYMPLPGPHMVDFIIVMSYDQVVDFMQRFQQKMIGIEGAEEPKKKRAKPEPITEKCDHRLVRTFPQWVTSVQTQRAQVFGMSGNVAVVNAEHSLKIPAEDGDPDDLASILAQCAHTKDLAHPLKLNELGRVVRALRKSCGSEAYPYEVTDFVSLMAGSFKYELRPSTRISAAALCRPFRPNEFARRFMHPITGDIDATTYLWDVPWYAEPSLPQLELVFNKFHAAVGTEVTPESLGIEDGSVLRRLWPRSGIAGQNFSGQEDWPADAQLYGDPTRNTPVRVAVGGVSGVLGDSTVAKEYPRLWTLGGDNLAAVQSAQKQSPEHAFNELRKISHTAVTIAGQTGESGLPPQFSRIVMFLAETGATIAGMEPGPLKRTKRYLFGRTRGNMMKDGLMPLAWAEKVNWDTLSELMGIMPTQLYVVKAMWIAFFNIMCAETSSLDLVFQGGAGIGKSHGERCAAKMIATFFTRLIASESGKALVYMGNVDNMFKIYDESKWFSTVRGAANRIDAEEIERKKTELESAVLQHSVAAEVIDPETGVVSRKTQTIMKPVRGGGATMANGPAVLPEVGDRHTVIAIENPGESGDYSGSLDGPWTAHIYLRTAYLHSASQLLCCLLQHFFPRGSIIQVDLSPVSLFLGILKKSSSFELGCEIPSRRREKDLQTAVKACTIEEVALTTFGTNRGNPDDNAVTFTQKQLAAMALKASMNLVASSQAVLTAYSALFPINTSEIRWAIENCLFNGTHLLFKDGLKGTDATDAWPWEKVGKPDRQGDNMYVSTPYESLPHLAEQISSSIETNFVKRPDRVVVEGMLDKMTRPSNQSSQPAILRTVSVQIESANRAPPRQSTRVAVLQSALSGAHTPTEAVLASGFLSLISAMPFYEVRFGVDVRCRKKHTWVCVPVFKAPSFFEDATVTRGDNTWFYPKNGLCVIDPHTAFGAADEGSVTAAIADDVRNGRVYPVSDRVVAMADLVSGDAARVASATTDRLEADVVAQDPGGAIDTRRRDGMKGAHILSKDTIGRQLVATTAKCMDGEAGVPPFNIASISGEEAAWFAKPRGGQELPTGTPFGEASGTFHETKPTGSGYYVKVYLDECIRSVQATLDSSQSWRPAFADAVQIFDGAMTGTAEWRSAKRPSVLVGHSCRTNSNRKSELVYNEIRYREHPPTEVADTRFVDSKAGSYSDQISVEERAAAVDVTSRIFPGTQSKITITNGQNIHARQIAARFESFFGPGWHAVPKIRKLVSPWVTEFSGAGYFDRLYADAEADAEADADGAVPAMEM